MTTRRPIVLVSGVQSELPAGDFVEGASTALVANPSGLYIDSGNGRLGSDGQSSSVNFVTSGSGAVGRSVQSVLRDRVSVLDFGADPTGSTDSTTAFSNALAVVREVYVPIGTYIVNNLDIPDGAVLTGELGTVDSERPVLVTDTNDAAIFVSAGSPSYIKLSRITARPSDGVTGTSFFRMTNPGPNMAQYCEFDDITTYRGFAVSYDGFFIFGQWKNCFDGYEGAPYNAYHAFIRSAPTDQNVGGVGQTNICIVRDTKVFQAFGTVPNRSGATDTDGAASVILAYGSLWNFVNTDFESLTDCAAVIARGVKSVTFENCWYESISHTFVVGLENLPLTVGQIVSYPLSFKNCNFNLTSVTSGGNLVQIESDSTPIPDGEMEWYTPRVVIDSCNFGSLISGSGKVSNISKQIVIQNCRLSPDNSDGFAAFLDEGTHVALKDADGNLLNDAKVTSFVNIRRVSLPAYGDANIGGWQCVDTDNDKVVSKMVTTAYNSGENGEITWSTNVSSTPTPFFTATHAGRYFRFDSTTGGIQFNGDTAAANALNDYEEGNFGVGLQIAGATINTGQETGRYVKIGKFVLFSFHLIGAISEGSSSSSIFITLPTTAISATYDVAGGGTLQAINSIGVRASVIQNTNTAQLFNITTNAALTPTLLGMTSSNIRTFRGVISYRSAT